jgi:hypothetical protein
MSSKASVQPRMIETGDQAGAFSAGLDGLLDRIECRRAESREDRESIFRLRYQAYLREGAIAASASATFSDDFDDCGNVHLFGLYIDHQLASSIRIHVGSYGQRHFPSLAVFPDVLIPKLDNGQVIIDPTRFVSDEVFSRKYRGLPYATLRLTLVAAEYFGANYVLAAVRREHQAFYRRAFYQRVLCEPRAYPNLIKPIGLMAMCYPAVRDKLWVKYPFFPNVSERRQLFGAKGALEREDAVPTIGTLEAMKLADIPST